VDSVIFCLSLSPTWNEMDLQEPQRTTGGWTVIQHPLSTYNKAPRRTSSVISELELLTLLAKLLTKLYVAS
jgi:hypothetical protein